MNPPIAAPDCEPHIARLFTSPEHRARLDKWGGMRLSITDSRPSADEYVRRCRGARAVVSNWPLPVEVLRLGIEAVFFLGAGVSSHVDLDEARANEVAVFHTPGYGTAGVAEHAVALMMASLRDIPRLASAMRRGDWPAAEPAPLVQKSTVGIIGYGDIGRRVTEMVSALGAEVLIWTRTPERHPSVPAGASMVPDLDELLPCCDVVSLHLALSPESAGLLTRWRLSSLRDGALLVNTARAELVDQQALFEELEVGRLKGAFDVFADEPLASRHPLRNLDSVVLTPHIGYHVAGALPAIVEMTIENLEYFFQGTGTAHQVV